VLRLSDNIVNLEQYRHTLIIEIPTNKAANSYTLNSSNKISV